MSLIKTFFLLLFFPEAILKNKQITCTDAAFVLAYSICQREKNTHLYSFTEKADELKSLHGLIPKNDFERAKKVIEENMVRQKKTILCAVSLTI